MNSTPKLSLIIARSFRLVCRKYSAYLTSKWDQLSAITAASAVKIVLSFLGMRSTESMQFVRYSCCHVWCWLRDTKTWQHLKIILVFWSTPNPRFVAAYKNKKGLGRKAAINRCYKMRCVDGKRILGNPGATRRIVSISSAALPQSCVTSQKTAAAETTRRIRRDEAILYFRANIFAIPSHATRCFGVCVTEEKSHYAHLICWMFGVPEYSIELNRKSMKREDRETREALWYQSALWTPCDSSFASVAKGKENLWQQCTFAVVISPFLHR